ncbi:hypothetical protein [Emticicia sp. W12TSBA100-4]|uniref:hypothetical protein n=1 Tax=Emticicia sp. W12TSBA100-4 TaxID=3160965 RepID=UPI0033065440
MRKIGHNVYVHQNTKGVSTVITFGKDADKVVDGSVYSENEGKVKGQSAKYIKRGNNDDKLLKMHLIASKSVNKWQLISTKASFIAGWGLGMFTPKLKDFQEFYEPYLSNEFRDWCDNLDLFEYLQAAAYQLAFSNELNVRVSIGMDGKVSGLQVIDNNEIRIDELKGNETTVKRFLISGKFGFSKSVKREDCLVLPAFDPKDPTKYPESVIHLIKRIPMQKFTGLAEWWGTEDWANITNTVPDYYESLFANGTFITHQVSFPDDYFEVEGLTEEEKKAEKERTLFDLADTLSGIEKGNKIIVTFSRVSADGKTTKEVKITPLENPINDEAFMKMLAIANQMQASGHGVQGALAGVSFGNEMGTSGKEMIVSADYMQDFLTFFDRGILLKPIRYAQKIDGFEVDKVIMVKRIQSYTFDSTPKNKDTTQK